MAADADERSKLQRQLSELMFDAHQEAVSAISAKLEEGRQPRRLHRFPTFALRDNGMPSLGDGAWENTGPLEYSSLLDPPFGDDEARSLGKFPPDRFPAIAALVAFAFEHPEIARIHGAKLEAGDPFTKIGIDLLVASTADMHFLRFGLAPVSAATRASVLKPVFKGLFDERLNVAILAPIAFARFDFDRLGIGPSAFVMRMSPNLQRARWAAKAYGANGHDQVLAAATHAFVLTGWGIPNDHWFGLAQSLSTFHADARVRIDALFAALRLETGIETGYAQEVRLARGWCHRHNYGLPEVHAVGARRYPEAFDDFGWTRTDLPLIAKEHMRAVAELHQALAKSSDERLALAIRRLNAAMTRAETADAILDATIALEILLGDGDGQAISWKLRMRAAALAGIDHDREAAATMSKTIDTVYAARSAIVHGGRRRRGNLEARNDRDGEAKQLAITTLRQLLKVLARRPEYLDPRRIDSDLLMAPPPRT